MYINLKIVPQVAGIYALSIDDFFWGEYINAREYCPFSLDLEFA